MQPYLGVSAFSSTVEKSVSERIHRSSGAIRLLFPGPIRSFPSHRRQISARHERERKEEGGGEGGIVEESRTWSNGKLLSNKIPRIYGERSGNDLPGRQNSLSTSGKSITSLSSPPRPVSSLFPLRIDWHRGLSHK